MNCDNHLFEVVTSLPVAGSNQGLLAGLDVCSFPVAGSKYKLSLGCGLDVCSFPVVGSKYKLSLGSGRDVFCFLFARLK